MIVPMDKLIFNKYLWLILFPLLAGWFALTLRMETRTDLATGRQLNSVKKIWGGNLQQPMPSFRYKGFSSEVSSLSVGDIHASDISVRIKVDYRKKGLMYYTGYNADFSGRYTIRNPKEEKIYLSFIFPFPMREGEGLLRDVKLLVNGEEDRNNTEYQPNLILWTGLLEPEKEVEIQVNYTGRGLNHFIYGFERTKQIKRFHMRIDIDGRVDVDYPVSTMSPTRVESTERGGSLVWELESALTQLNIGVILPDRTNIAGQISVMAKRAPVFFLMFLSGLFVSFLISKTRYEFVQIAVISAAYFLFYPVFAYLSAYMEAVVAFTISFLTMGLLIVNYSRVVFGLKNALVIGAAYVFFLGITTIAALLPLYTGLILVIEGVVLLAVVMQVLSRHRDIRLGELFQNYI